MLKHAIIAPDNYGKGILAMAITKSFNKHNQTYYVYDTSYVWNEEKQKKVQKRRCIGKWDPVQEKILPTGKRGRPNELNAKLAEIKAPPVSSTNDSSDSDQRRAKVFNAIATDLTILQSVLSNLASDFKVASELIIPPESLLDPANDNNDKERDEDGKKQKL